MIIKKDAAVMGSYLEDSSNIKGGHAEEVVIPANISELSSFMKEANARKSPVTISGGGTGTTGSRIPFGGVSLSMEKFAAIKDVSTEKMSCVAEAGVLVEDLKNSCEKKGLFYTSHPTERTASVGGTVSTNASGARSFKYGSTRRYVKRLKMVLPQGDIFEIERGDVFIDAPQIRIRPAGGSEIVAPLPTYRVPEIKNSAGYFAKNGMDIIDLFIGQEGTLSVIVEVEMALVKKSEGILSVFVFFGDEKDAWDFADDARNSNLDALSIEYFDNNALRLLREKNSNVPDAGAAIFFEQETRLSPDDKILDEWIRLIEKHGSSAGKTWVAMNEKEAEDFTKMRHFIPERINEIIARKGYRKISTDIAVPHKAFYEMMNFYKKTLDESGMDHIVFGHIGESHLHVNLIPSSVAESDKAFDICSVFARKAVSHGGTISAEHGVGKTKHKYLEMMYGRKGVMEMARIKKAFDPNCILGMGNIFPEEVLLTL